MHVEKYIECLDKEINDMIQEESEKMTPKGEEMLHILLENRKHIAWWKEQKYGTHHDMAMDKSRGNPYLGGIKL